MNVKRRKNHGPCTGALQGEVVSRKEGISNRDWEKRANELEDEPRDCGIQRESSEKNVSRKKMWSTMSNVAEG